MDAEIDAVSRKMNELVSASDIEGILEILTDDVVFLPPGADPKVGREAYRQWVTEFQRHYRVSHIETVSREIRRVGDWAYEWGLVREEYVPRGTEPPAALVGKFMRTFQRQRDGKWKIARAIWNSNSS